MHKHPRQRPTDRQSVAVAAAVLALLAGLAVSSTGAAQSGAERAAAGEAGQALDSVAEQRARLPYRGTSFTLGSAASALSVAPGAELTYNPFVALTLDFRAYWWLTDWLYFRGQLEAARELTQADDTTYEGEVLLGDGLLQLGAAEPWRDPWLGIAVSGSADLVLPTSKRAQGETRLLTAAASLGLSRRWTHVLGAVDAIEIGYTFRPAKAFHRYTTASYAAPTITDCSQSPGGCEALLSNGLRNVSWSLDHSVAGALQVNRWVGIDVVAGTITGFLYPLAEVDGISYQVQDPVDTRYLNYFRLATTVTPLPALSVALGASTVNPQLRDDGTYRLPFFNRYTQLFADVRLDAAGLIAQLRGAEE